MGPRPCPRPRVSPNPPVMVEMILVVDDQVEQQELAEKYLIEAGYKVALAENGEQAIARLEEGGIDLVLLDVVMPGIDGFETFRRIRLLRGGANLPVIFLTA